MDVTTYECEKFQSETNANWKTICRDHHERKRARKNAESLTAKKRPSYGTIAPSESGTTKQQSVQQKLSQTTSPVPRPTDINNGRTVVVQASVNAFDSRKTSRDSANVSVGGRRDSIPVRTAPPPPPGAPTLPRRISSTNQPHSPPQLTPDHFTTLAETPIASVRSFERMFACDESQLPAEIPLPPVDVLAEGAPKVRLSIPYDDDVKRSATLGCIPSNSQVKIDMETEEPEQIQSSQPSLESDNEEKEPNLTAYQKLSPSSSSIGQNFETNENDINFQELTARDLIEQSEKVMIEDDHEGSSGTRENLDEVSVKSVETEMENIETVEKFVAEKLVVAQTPKSSITQNENAEERQPDYFHNGRMYPDDILKKVSEISTQSVDVQPPQSPMQELEIQSHDGTSDANVQPQVESRQWCRQPTSSSVDEPWPEYYEQGSFEAENTGEELDSTHYIHQNGPIPHFAEFSPSETQNDQESQSVSQSQSEEPQSEYLDPSSLAQSVLERVGAEPETENAQSNPGNLAHWNSVDDKISNGIDRSPDIEEQTLFSPGSETDAACTARSLQSTQTSYGDFLSAPSTRGNLDRPGSSDDGKQRDLNDVNDNPRKKKKRAWEEDGQSDSGSAKGHSRRDSHSSSDADTDSEIEHDPRTGIGLLTTGEYRRLAESNASLQEKTDLEKGIAFTDTGW